MTHRLDHGPRGSAQGHVAAVLVTVFVANRLTGRNLTSALG
jgi:hypothetical protein